MKKIKEMILGINPRDSKYEFINYSELTDFIEITEDVTVMCNRYCASEIIMNLKINEHMEVSKDVFPYDEEIVLFTRFNINGKVCVIMESAYNEDGTFKTLEDTRELLVDLDLVELVLDQDELEAIEEAEYKTFTVGLC